MSIEATCKTQMTEEDVLIEAVGSIMGTDKVSKVAQGVEVTGYRSKKMPTVVIDLGKGAWGTAGYCKTAEGSWELVYDSSDRSRIKPLLPSEVKGVKHDPVMQAYSKVKVNRAIKKMRGRISQETTDKNGGIRLKVKVTN